MKLRIGGHGRDGRSDSRGCDMRQVSDSVLRSHRVVHDVVSIHRLKRWVVCELRENGRSSGKWMRCNNHRAGDKGKENCEAHGCVVAFVLHMHGSLGESQEMFCEPVVMVDGRGIVVSSDRYVYMMSQNGCVP